MINETQHWKRELDRWSGELSRKQRQRVWTAPTNARVERCVLLGFYAIRKLLESKKLSLPTAERNVSLVAFSRGIIATKPVLAPLLSVHYNLEQPVEKSLGLGAVCHQVVHSYVFSVVVKPGVGLQGFFLASDWKRNEQLLFVEAEETIDVFSRVAKDRAGEFDPSVREKIGDDMEAWTGFPLALK